MLSPSVITVCVITVCVITVCVITVCVITVCVITVCVITVCYQSVLSPSVLSPSVLSPSVLSPSVLSLSVLSPSVLSPSVLSLSVLSLLSPCYTLSVSLQACLRQMDISLLSQLWTLNDNIYRYKQRLQLEDTISETMSEGSNTSLNATDDNEYENAATIISNSRADRTLPEAPIWATPDYENSPLLDIEINNMNNATGSESRHRGITSKWRSLDYENLPPSPLDTPTGPGRSLAARNTRGGRFQGRPVEGVMVHDYETLYEPTYLLPLSQRTPQKTPKSQPRAGMSPIVGVADWLRPVNHTFESNC